RTTASASPSRGAMPSATWTASRSSWYRQATVSRVTRSESGTMRWSRAKRAATHAASCWGPVTQKKPSGAYPSPSGAPSRYARTPGGTGGAPAGGRQRAVAFAAPGAGGEAGQPGREVVGAPGRAERAGDGDQGRIRVVPSRPGRRGPRRGGQDERRQRQPAPR